MALLSQCPSGILQTYQNFLIANRPSQVCNSQESSLKCFPFTPPVSFNWILSKGQCFMSLVLERKKVMTFEVVENNNSIRAQVPASFFELAEIRHVFSPVL